MGWAAHILFPGVFCMMRPCDFNYWPRTTIIRNLWSLSEFYFLYSNMYCPGGSRWWALNILFLLFFVGIKKWKWPLSCSCFSCMLSFKSLLLWLHQTKPWSLKFRIYPVSIFLGITFFPCFPWRLPFLFLWRESSTIHNNRKIKERPFSLTWPLSITLCHLAIPNSVLLLTWQGPFQRWSFCWALVQFLLPSVSSSNLDLGHASGTTGRSHSVIYYIGVILCIWFSLFELIKLFLVPFSLSLNDSGWSCKLAFLQVLD